MGLKGITKRIISKAFRTFNYAIRKLPADKTLPADLDRLKKLSAKTDKIKLHFGCGPRILKGWINIDLSYEPFGAYLQYYTDKHYPAELRGSKDDLFIINVINDGLPLEDSSVDVIFHEDFFEHLSQKQQFVFLAETLRVMKPGAVHRINTPNIIAAMRDNSLFSKGKSGVYTAEWDNWHHHNIISPAILKEMAKIVGYTDIIFNSKDNSIAANTLPPEYRPDPNDRHAPDGNVFADLIK